MCNSNFWRIDSAPDQTAIRWARTCAHRARSDDKVGDDVPGDDLGIGQLVDYGREVDLLLRPDVRVVEREEVQTHEEDFHHDKLGR